VIPTAAVAQASSVVLVLAVVYWIEGPFSVRAFDRKEARALLGYGGWISVSNIVSPILASLDQFLVGSIMGVAAVAHYTVPMNLVVRSQIFPAALARTSFPRMSSLPADGARALGARALLSLGYGYAAVCAPAIILSPVFFRYWIGADFALLAAPVAQILFLGAWINGLAFIAFTLLQGQGRPDITGKLHMVELVPFLAILWILTSTLGIKGAAISWSLRCAADALALFWMSGINRRDVLSALRPAVLLAASEVGTWFVGSRLELALPAAVLVGLIGVGLAYTCSADWRQLIDVQFGARARRFSGSWIWRGRSSGSL
jgi:O-antigen/teichoic acid export membrane protein